MRWSGQIFWLLAFGPENFEAHLLPAFTAGLRRAIGSWEVVSSYSSATAPGLHGISRADPLIKLAKNYARDNRSRFATQEVFPSATHENRVAILSLAARRKGIARCAVLYLDCARSALEQVFIGSRWRSSCCVNGDK